MPMYKLLPKVGFRSKIKAERAEVLLYKLEALAIEVIDFAVLREARLIPAGVKQVKVVKKGEITRRIVLRGVGATAGAKAAIRSEEHTSELQSLMRTSNA